MIDGTKKPGREKRAGFDTSVTVRVDSVRPWAVGRWP